MSEVLSGKNIADVNLYYRNFNSCNGIGNSNRCMGVSTSIYYYSFAVYPEFLDLIYQLSFNIALKVIKLITRITLNYFIKKFFKGFVTIDAWLPLTQEV